MKPILELFTFIARLSVALSFTLYCAGCIMLEEDNSKSIINTGDYQYDVYAPVKKYTLPGRLVEISGIDYWKDSILLCIEDEKGYLYLYDHGQEEVIQEIKFGKKGDYEGGKHKSGNPGHYGI